MSLASIDWTLPGCGASCAPRRHDPHAHEIYGLATALMALRVPPPTIIRTGPLALDLKARAALVNGERVPLTRREWEILAFLGQNLGRCCDADEILAAVWGPHAVMPGVMYIDPRGKRRGRADLRLVNVNVNRARAKLGPAARLLTTRWLSYRTGRCLELEPPI